MSAGVLPGMRYLDGASPWRIPQANRTPGRATLVSVLAHLSAGLLVVLAMTPEGVGLSGGSGTTSSLVALEVPFVSAEDGSRAEEAAPVDVVAEPEPALPAMVTPPPPPVPAPPSMVPLPREAVAVTMPPPPLEASPAPPLPAVSLPQGEPATAAMAEAPPPRPESAPQSRTAPVIRPSPAGSRPIAPRRRPGPASLGAVGVGEATPTAASGPAGTPLAFSPPLITAARFRRPPRPPEYPPRAIDLDLHGTVLVRALLDPEGDPREVRVHRSSGHALLDHAAVAAVSRWAFEPASRDGLRIPAWVEVPVHFRLH
jgi:protein TonB